MGTPRTTVHRSGSAFTEVPYRSPTAGPEFALVNEFLAEQLPPPPRGQSLAVFVEPAIESGFPDLVAVYWNESVANRWRNCRAELTAADIRVVHFLATAGDGDPDTLKFFFQYRLSCSLDRLHSAGLVYRAGGCWWARSLSTIFAVRRLVAIEAKVTNPYEGLMQAFQNTWFASESYLLLPRLPRASRLADAAARFGVGVAEQGKPLRLAGVRPRQQNIPISYASWMFNEWAWRAACSRG